jgi:hypothetical protein
MKAGMHRWKLLLMLSLLLTPLYLYAQPQDENQYEEPVYVYEYPEISPEVFIRPNYSFLKQSGSNKAGEFWYLHSSIGGDVLLTAFPFPHRIHMELEALNKKDYFGDIRYAYKDIALFRGLTRGFYHNLDNKTLIDAGSSPKYTIEQRDAGKEYGISNNISNLFLRLKTPDYPFHIFVDTQIIKRDGTIQQRYLSSYLPLKRVSMERDIEWESKTVTIGANTHLGPVELELSHGEKRLDVKGERLLENSYGANIYPHNLIPELKGSTTTFKIHTSYTGQFVASATISRTERENQDSGAKADYFTGAADITYMPQVNLTIFLRYRHKNSDIDNPDSIPANYLGYPSYASPIPVRPAIDSTTDTVSGTVRYRLAKGITLYGEYSGEKVHRSNSEAWKLPEDTTKNTLSFTASLRPLNSLDLKARYTHQEIDAPAYNNQPETSDEGRISVNWRPTQRINSLLTYSIALQKRDEINFIDDGIEVKAKDRDLKREKFFGSLTFILTERLNFSPTYAYIRNRTRQDLLYDNTGTIPEYHIDNNVLYRDTSHIYGINLNYVPVERLNLNTDITYTISKGTFYPGVLISDIKEIKALEAEADIKETGITIRTEYDMKRGWSAGIRYTFINYNDGINDTLDSEAHLIFMSLSKRW